MSCYVIQLPNSFSHPDPHTPDEGETLITSITRLAAANDKVYRLLAHGRRFSPGTPASFTTKTGRHDIAEILLKVALKHKIRRVDI
jgi:hypothetical protein